MKINFKRIFRWIRNIIIIWFALSVLTVVLYKYMPVYVTPLMISRTLGQWWDGEKVTWEHRWVPIKEISPKLIQAVVASEDNLFMEHHGFDFQQIQKAVEERKDGKRKRGASTISQQTAKNIFLFPSRGFVRKGFEAYFTVLIEWIWGKERIMEVYLNSIEMGKGIYGAEKVAEKHFSKPALNLTAGEAALIAATLPNPLRFNSAKPTAYLIKRQQAILDLMQKIGPVTFKEASKENTRKKQ